MSEAFAEIALSARNVSSEYPGLQPVESDQNAIAEGEQLAQVNRAPQEESSNSSQSIRLLLSSAFVFELGHGLPVTNVGETAKMRVLESVHSIESLLD